MRHLLIFSAILIKIAITEKVLIIANGVNVDEVNLNQLTGIINDLKTNYQLDIANALRSSADNIVDVIRINPADSTQSTLSEGSDVRVDVGADFKNFLSLSPEDEGYENDYFNFKDKLDRSLYSGFIQKSNIKNLKESEYDVIIHQHDDIYANGIAQHLNSRRIILTRNGAVTRGSLRAIGAQVFSSLLPDESQAIAVNHNHLDRAVSFLINGIQWLKSYKPDKKLAFIGEKLDRVGKYFEATSLLVASSSHWEPTNLYPSNVIFARTFKNETSKKNQSGTSVVVDIQNVPRELLNEIFSKFPTVSFVLTQQSSVSTLPANVASSTLKTSISNAKLLITHGSHDTILEAVQHGVPLLLIPRTNEEFRNADLTQLRGAAKVINPGNLTSEVFLEEIDKILHIGPMKEHVLQISKTVSTPEAELLIRRAVKLSILQDKKLSLDECFFRIISADLFVLLVVVSLITRVLLKWYYWSCFELNKLKLD